jgi:hypothetical protein
MLLVVATSAHASTATLFGGDQIIMFAEKSTTGLGLARASDVRERVEVRAAADVCARLRGRT